MSGQDPQIARSARHVALAQIGTAGQAKIESARVLLIGLGGIGCAAASYLASSGVGQLFLNDFDSVDESNLGRQILYGPADVGKLKVDCAARQLALANPNTSLNTIAERLDAESLPAIVEQVDIVLDGTDNFATRFLINDVCTKTGRRLVSGSAIRFEGQLAVFGPDYQESVCYRCLYSEADESLDNCAGNGVLSTIPGVVGALMATEALKSIAGLDVKTNQLHVFDGLAVDWRTIRIPKRIACPGCSASAD